MAAQTLTAVSNFDGPALMLGLNNGEATTINGGALTIDGDVRWGQNAAVLGNVSISTTLGGSVLFEGRNAWELPFTASSGNVPTLETLGSNGVTGGTSGATGELFRVWGTDLAPVAAGGAMPASGFIKLRSKTGNFSAGEVITLPGGATVTISNAGKRSWIHVVGVETGTLTISRLGSARFRGEWFELGQTNGADDQTFQFPVADACPAIWIEKTPGSYAADGMDGLEPWLAAGDRWGTATPFVAEDVRGKYFGQDLSTGVITIAQRASNACGFKPASGLKVFCPNIILSSSTSANWAANTINATINNRYKTGTTAGADVDATGASCNWYLTATNPVNVVVRRSAFLERVDVINPAKETLLEDFAIGVRLATSSYPGLALTSLFNGGTLRRVRLGKGTQGDVLTIINSVGVYGEKVQAECFGNVGSQDRSATSIVCVAVSRSSGIRFVDFSLLGARLRIVAAGVRVDDMKYADRMLGDTNGSGVMPAVEATGGADGCYVYGFSNFGGLANVHPNTRILAVAEANNVGLFDVGSPTNEYDFGTVSPGNGPAAFTNARTVRMRRVYTKNCFVSGAGSPVDISTSVQNAEIVNVWSDYDDPAPMAGVNVLAKGSRWSIASAVRATTYGRHWEDAFGSETSGRISIWANEPTDATAGQCVASLASGSGFTSTGGVSMAAVGDTVEWTMPYFALGHTALENAAPVITGNNVGNHYIEFQADTGSGFSSWQELTAANLAAVGAINPNTGVKLKVRATVTVANASNFLSILHILTVTDAVSQRIQYPITDPFTVSLEGVVIGSIVHVETAAGAPVYTVIAAAETVLLPLTAYEEGSPLNDLRIKVRKGSSSPFYQPYRTQVTAAPGAVSIFVSQIPDE